MLWIFSPGLNTSVCGNHRIMFRVGILRDVEVLLHRSFGVGEETPLGPHRRAELLQSACVIRQLIVRQNAAGCEVIAQRRIPLNFIFLLE